MVASMAMKKTLAQRLFNISNLSTQALRNCRISSSAVHIRPAAKPREPDDVRNADFRRSIHAGVAPEMWTFPVGESLMEQLRFGGAGRSRIRLEGLSPPSPETATAATAGWTAEETRKVLMAARMEAVKARLREKEVTWMTYAEFVRVCEEVFSDPGQGVGFARKMDESGAVIVLGNVVCVKPEQVAKAIQDLIPISGVTPSDAKMRELEAMEKQKSVIDQKADALVRRELWLGLGYFVVQTAGFMRLTFWELSWDVMEPICFYVTSIYFMACYAFFLRTSKEPCFEGFFKSRFHAKQKKLMKDHNFDLARYEKLRKSCYPLAPSASDNLSAACLGAKRSAPLQFGSSDL